MGARRRKEAMLNRQRQVLGQLERDGKATLVLCPLCKTAFCPGCSLGPDGKMEEEHAPQKLYRGDLPEARCLCCGICNDSAHPYEHKAAPRIGLRKANHKCVNFAPFAPASNGLLISTCGSSGTTRGHELGLDRLVLPMAVTDSEKLVELKSALLIAFAALGHTYVLGSGPDQVRTILSDGRPPAHTCISIPRQLVELGERSILIVERPLPAVLVLYPSPHCTSGFHAVVLPPAEHSGSFYWAWHLASSTKAPIGVTETYPWPAPRELPFHWDTCPGAHPRMQKCVGLELDDSHSIHYGWRHRSKPTHARAS